MSWWVIILLMIGGLAILLGIGLSYHPDPPRPRPRNVSHQAVPRVPPAPRDSGGGIS